MCIRLLLFALIQLTASVLFAQAGSLDNSFAGNGKKQTNTGGSAVAVAVQPTDQKILVAGGTTVVRYTTTGTLDNAFGSGGIATLDFGNAFVNIHAMAIQPDGKIVLAGTYQAPTGQANLFVTRLTTTGLVDGNFNNIGFNTVPHYNQVSGAMDGATAVAIQPDGKIVACGEYYDETTGVDNKRGPFYLGVVRFTGTGQLDNSFATGGQVITYPGNKKTAPTGIAITPAGKIIVCGYRMRWLLDNTITPDSVLVAQYTSDGVLDAAAFGTNGTGGFARYTVGSDYDCHANAITLQPDGRILLAGYFASGGVHPNFLVMRLNTNGTLDNNFAGNGKLAVGFGNQDFASGIGLEPGTGAIVVAGITEPSAGNQFAVCRVSTTGVPDNSFGAAGKVTIPWTGSAPMSTTGTLAIQSNGRIVVTGTARTAPPNNVPYMATIRLLSSGSGFTILSDSLAVTRTAAGFSTDNRAGIKLYPNPAATELAVSGLSTGEPALLTVTDMAGRTLLRQRTNAGNILLDISRLAPSSYFLTVTGTANRQSFPFVKVP
ncbi:T9SS type A sorting domain-containing protein [Puia sp.]|uniref:T9SS type A sorting domain-containing protein n=1 Tax=Puia sp. TaxID=2045100 RepID=UPI002F3E9586